MTRLPTLAQAVDVDDVRRLLLSRAPTFLQEGDPRYEGILKGIATEVVSIVGTSPAAGTVRDLAVWAITLGAAALIEESIAPEQMLDDDSGPNSSMLQRKYVSILAQLRALPSTGEEGALPLSGLSPQGSFPDPSPSLDHLFADQGPAARWPGGPAYMT